MNIDLRKNLTDLLATLRAIHWHAWNTHWKAKGTEAYSDHLLFERIYSGEGGGPSINDQIDALGERMIALLGNDAVNGVEISQKATKIQQGIKGLGMAAGALKLEQSALDQVARIADLVAKGPPALRIGLDNFVRELADARSTVIYLLQQRLKGGSDNYGDAMNSTFSPYASALFPVVLSTVVGVAAARGLDQDPIKGAMVGTTLGVIWSIAQQEKQDETALPNGVGNVLPFQPSNLVRISDHPDYYGTVAEEEPKSGQEKLVYLGAIALIGLVAYRYVRPSRF